MQYGSQCNRAFQMNNLAFVLLFSYTVWPDVATHYWNISKQQKTSFQQEINFWLGLREIPARLVQFPARHRVIFCHNLRIFKQVKNNSQWEVHAFPAKNLSKTNHFQQGMHTLPAGNAVNSSKNKAIYSWKWKQFQLKMKHFTARRESIQTVNNPKSSQKRCHFYLEMSLEIVSRQPHIFHARLEVALQVVPGNDLQFHNTAATGNHFHLGDYLSCLMLPEDK